MPEEVEGQVEDGGAAGAEEAIADEAADGAETEDAPAVPRTVDSAIEEARERMARGEPITPAEEADAEAEPAHEEEEAAEEEGAEGDDESPAGDGPDDPEAEAEEEPEGEGEDPEAEGEEAPELAVAVLPGRGPDDPDLEIEIPEELVEDFNRLRNGYMRGEEFRRQEAAVTEKADRIAADQEEIDFIERALRDDPVGFVLERVDRNLRVDLLRSLLADDEVWSDEKLQDEIQQWERDPGKRELFSERTRRERLESKEKLNQEREIKAEMREGAAETARNVKALIPEEWEPERTSKFWRLTMKTLGEEAGRRGSSRFTPEEVIQTLDKAGILDGYGIDPAAARTSDPDEGSDRDGTRQNGERRKARRTTRPTARKRTVTAEEAQGTGKRLKEESERRKEAATYAPAGAGAPAASIKLPKGQSIKERIATVQKLGGISRVLGGR